MAKKKRKKKGYGRKRKSKARKHPKRSRSAKRAYKGSALHKYNMRRKKGHGGRKKKGYGRKKRRRSSKHSIYGAKQRHQGRKQSAAAGRATRALVRSVKATYQAKGYTPKQAQKLASRYVRALKHRAHKAGAAPTHAERVAAAMQASMRSGHSYAN